jgi:hypothetical protein
LPSPARWSPKKFEGERSTVTSRNKKVQPQAELQSPSASFSALAQELRETNLLALNAAVRSAQDGVTGEELFGMLQQVRQLTSSSLERIHQIQAQTQGAS